MDGLLELLKQPAWFWLVVTVILVLIELLTVGLTTIWFAGGGVVAMIASVAGADLCVSFILFLVVSIALLLTVRPYAKKQFNVKRTKTNADRLVGQEGIVLEAIDNITATGRVTVMGQEWAAKTADESKLPVGERVQILSISGVKLIVKRTREESL